jgi:cytochrome b561
MEAKMTADTGVMGNPRDRYTRVAVILHWLIAVSIIAMIPIGWWMGDTFEALQNASLWVGKDAEKAATQSTVFAIVQIHKSVGLTILVLSVARLVWRLMNPPPPLPPGMKGWEISLANLTHVLFYVLIIGLPLSGWVMVSASPYGLPTLWFGLFEWPHLPGLHDLAPDVKKTVSSSAGFAHGRMAWGVIVLLVLHVGAALKHHFINKDTVLTRMLPFLKAPNATL